MGKSEERERRRRKAEVRRRSRQTKKRAKAEGEPVDVPVALVTPSDPEKGVEMMRWFGRSILDEPLDEEIVDEPGLEKLAERLVVDPILFTRATRKWASTRSQMQSPSLLALARASGSEIPSGSHKNDVVFPDFCAKDGPEIMSRFWNTTPTVELALRLQGYWMVVTLYHMRSAANMVSFDGMKQLFAGHERQVLTYSALFTGYLTGVGHLVGYTVNDDLETKVFDQVDALVAKIEVCPGHHGLRSH